MPSYVLLFGEGFMRLLFVFLSLVFIGSVFAESADAQIFRRRARYSYTGSYG